MSKESLPTIVFMGTPEFATTILKKIVEEGYPVAACVTAPDKPAGRGRKVQESHVKQYAVSQEITVLQPTNLKEESFVNELNQLNADLFIVVAFRMLPEIVWRIPRLGTINLHGSLLPDYRGAAPINWAVMNGDQKTGVTTFFINENIDTGDLLLKREMDIAPNESAGSVHDRMMHLGAETIIETIQGVNKGTLKAIPQSEINDSPKRPAPKIFKNDCRIDFSKDAKALHDFIRGLSPYPGAWLRIKNTQKDQVKTLKIFETNLTEGNIDNVSEEARLIISDNKLYLIWNENQLEICSLQLEGKKRLPSTDFLSGFKADEWEILID